MTISSKHWFQCDDFVSQWWILIKMMKFHWCDEFSSEYVDWWSPVMQILPEHTCDEFSSDWWVLLQWWIFIMNRCFHQIYTFSYQWKPLLNKGNFHHNCKSSTQLWFSSEFLRNLIQWWIFITMIYFHNGVKFISQ